MAPWEKDQKCGLHFAPMRLFDLFSVAQMVGCRHITVGAFMRSRVRLQYSLFRYGYDCTAQMNNEHAAVKNVGAFELWVALFTHLIHDLHLNQHLCEPRN